MKMEKDFETFREYLLVKALDESQYQLINTDYLSTIPLSVLSEIDGTVIDYEGHCNGLGDHDFTNELDEKYFSMFSNELSYVPQHERGVRFVMTDCLQVFELLRCYSENADGEKLQSLFGSYCVPCSHVPATEKGPIPLSSFRKRETSTLAGKEEDEILLKSTNRLHDIDELILDCESWTSCSIHCNRCLSAVFLGILLLLPNLKALKIRKLQWTDASLFANFPSPFSVISSDSFDYNVPPADFAVSPLTTILFYKCHVSSADLYFLADCAVEHKILPSFRNLKLYYCSGMSYTSITSTLSSAVNLVFDRFEMSGWCWPQEPVNPKRVPASL
jgi:hypothetical protein